MDIEGSELYALEGAREHIKKDMPCLAICVYHMPDDIRKIPQKIYDINQNYSLYIRQYNTWYDDETVLYAVPKQKGFINRSIAETQKNNCENRLLESFKLLSSFYNKNNLELKEAHYWLKSQVNNYQKELKNQNKVITELRQWVSQLEEGKQWLETQMNNYKTESERKEEIIKRISK
jgi:hypothetical protein